jgi:hypothetical protein
MLYMPLEFWKGGLWGFCSSFGDEFFGSVVVGVRIDALIEPIFIKFSAFQCLC